MGGIDKRGFVDLTDSQVEAEIVYADEDVVLKEEIVLEDIADRDFDKEVIAEANRDLVKQFVGVISAIVPLLAVFGIKFDWLNESTATLLATAVVLGASFVVNVYTMWKNHYTSSKAKAQKRALKQKGLK